MNKCYLKADFYFRETETLLKNGKLTMDAYSKATLRQSIGLPADKQTYLNTIGKKQRKRKKRKMLVIIHILLIWLAFVSQTKCKMFSFSSLLHSCVLTVVLFGQFNQILCRLDAIDQSKDTHTYTMREHYLLKVWPESFLPFWARKS